MLLAADGKPYDIDGRNGAEKPENMIEIIHIADEKRIRLWMPTSKEVANFSERLIIYFEVEGREKGFFLAEKENPEEETYINVSSEDKPLCGFLESTVLSMTKLRDESLIYVTINLQKKIEKTVAERDCCVEELIKLGYAKRIGTQEGEEGGDFVAISIDRDWLKTVNTVGQAMIENNKERNVFVFGVG